MTRHETPILEYPLARRVNTGISIQAMPGVVPEYEEREAAVFAHYNWSDWCSLDWTERANAVAHYRLHSLIESHVNEAVERAQKRQSN